MSYDAIRKWYTGKPLTIIDGYVLPTLAEAARIGSWPKGASRKVRAALGKCNVAHKFAYAHDRADPHHKFSKNADGLMESIGKMDSLAHNLGWSVNHAMMFGLVGNIPNLLPHIEKLSASKLTAAQKPVWARAMEWVNDFAPVAKLMADLDLARPAVTVVMGTLSPTVAANMTAFAKMLGAGGVRLNLETRGFPPIEWKWITQTGKDGKPYRIQVGTILWPKGTLHNCSRFAGGMVNNLQCHACGHAIKNPWNWVPLVIDDEAAVPYALWVGKDCSKKLFGVTVTGDVEYEDDSSMMQV